MWLAPARVQKSPGDEKGDPSDGSYSSATKYERRSYHTGAVGVEPTTSWLTGPHQSRRFPRSRVPNQGSFTNSELAFVAVCGSTAARNGSHIIRPIPRFWGIEHAHEHAHLDGGFLCPTSGPARPRSPPREWRGAVPIDPMRGKRLSNHQAVAKRNHPSALDFLDWCACGVCTLGSDLAQQSSHHTRRRPSHYRPLGEVVEHRLGSDTSLMKPE